VAYQLRQNPGHETVVRSGFGVFYDVGNWTGLLNFYGGVGFGSFQVYAPVSFPFTPAQNTPPPPSITPPYNATVPGTDPHLKMPYTLQWNLAVEQALGSSQTLTVSYVAAGGRKLLATQYLDLTGTNPNFAPNGPLELYNNGSNSNYNSLQAQYQRRLSHGLQALVSYTWSHSIDNLSNDIYFGPSYRRGNSDFDVRHNFAAALTYDVPGRYSNPFVGAVLEHWGFDLRQSARSALPVDITSGYTNIGPAFVLSRPNFDPTVPLYISDPNAPGGRVVNISAFPLPLAGQYGNEPRNKVRGFDLWQTDLAMRRDFPLHERLKLQFRAEAFNLLNRPNFGYLYSSTSDPPSLFGRAESTLNNTLGGLNPLYQVGGPRSLQLALKIIF
jgi:hypothetical protein